MEAERVHTITVAVDLKTSKEAVAFSENRDGFYATLGLHPTDIVTETFDSKDYAELVKHPKVVGIGECGLDFFRIEGDVLAEKKRQWNEFEKQMTFALEHDLPLMIHCRPSKGTVDAYRDMADRLESEFKQVGERLRGNMHFFVGDVDVASRFYDIGFTTSFTGVVTFARDYDDVIRMAPLDMILTETDAPFASPVPFRGKRNEPLYVKYVVSALAQIKKMDEEDIRRATVSNAERLFLAKKAGIAS
jgi:TatD DNase family protein